MNIQITEYTERTIEIELPAYRKSGCHYYKVFSDEHCIQICTLDFNTSIARHHSGLAYSDKRIEDCSKEEFEENYNKVSELIKSFI